MILEDLPVSVGHPPRTNPNVSARPDTPIRKKRPVFFIQKAPILRYAQGFGIARLLYSPGPYGQDEIKMPRTYLEPFLQHQRTFMALYTVWRHFEKIPLSSSCDYNTKNEKNCQALCGASQKKLKKNPKEKTGRCPPAAGPFRYIFLKISLQKQLLV
jgi:hypothetical protein